MPINVYAEFYGTLKNVFKTNCVWFEVYKLYWL